MLRGKMIINFHDMPDETILAADICIVGSGPSGLALAREFLNTKTRVIVLETGGTGYEPLSESLNAGISIGIPFNGLTEGRRRQFGGAANTWGAVCVEMDHSDFEHRSWIPGSGWPINATDIAPFYRRARTMVRMSRTDYDAIDWRAFGMQAPAFNPHEIRFSVVGTTPIPNIAKTYFDDFRNATNIQTLLHAHVTELRTTADGLTIDQVDIRSLNGKRGIIKARAVVLCCGGIENARLLLMSRGVHQHGLGNTYDLVGRYYADHTISYSANIVTPPGQPLQPIFRSLRRRQSNLRPRLSLSAESQERASVLNCMAQIVFEHPSDGGFRAALALRKAIRFRRAPTDLSANLINIISHPKELAGMAIDRYLRGLHPADENSIPRLECRAEQLPDPESRITLSEKVDAFGRPLPIIDWHTNDLEYRTVCHMTNMVSQEFERLRLGRLEPEPWIINNDRSSWQTLLHEGFHHMGTTRMANSPRNGVVDVNANVYGVRGLYVAGTSGFPNSGFANGALTMIALSIRLADHLKQTLHQPTLTIAKILSKNKDACCYITHMHRPNRYQFDDTRQR